MQDLITRHQEKIKGSHKGSRMHIYSDASVSYNSEIVGIGVSVFVGKICIATFSKQLSISNPYKRVAIAEYMAIVYANSYVQSLVGRLQIRNVIIFSDSAEAIGKYRAKHIGSPSRILAKQLRLRRDLCLEIKHCKAHIGIEGNEVADKLAKLKQDTNQNYFIRPEINTFLQKLEQLTYKI